MQRPASTMCTVLPETVHLAIVVLLKLTARPEEAVALTVKSGSPKVLFPRAPNVIVWLAFCTVSVPFPVALSTPPPVVSAAFTVKLVPPGVFAGVVALVVMVRVDVLLDSAAVKAIGLGEKDAVTPVGNAVVTLKFALNAPADPGPEPRFTVIVKVVLPPVPYVRVPVCDPTVTDAILGASLNAVCVVKPEV